MPPKMRLKQATEVDMMPMILIGATAFASSPRRAILFPEHRRIKPVPGDDENDFRQSRWKSQFKEPTYHFIAAVEVGEDGSEEIVGFATWTNPCAPETEPTKEEQEAKKKELLASASKAMDVEAAQQMESTTNKWVESVMGEEGTKNYWVLQGLGVHPDHQRKGIGRSLVQWGIEEATKDGKDVWLIATPVGGKLYNSMGFETLAETVEYGEAMTMMVKKRKEAAV